MKRIPLIFCCVFPMIVSAQLIPGSIQTANGRIGFYEFKPAGYNPDSSYNYPLIIFMHGVGERGDGLTQLPRVLLQALPKLLAEGATMKFNINGSPEAFVVLMPQMSMNYINWQSFYIDSMISYATRNLKIDINKIFITGWSLGGGGAWKYTTSSMATAKRVSGIILAAPAPDYTNLCNIAKGNVAVWAFHALDDASVPIHFTEDAVEGINKCAPSIPALITCYGAGGHPFTAEAVYDTLNKHQYPNIYQWMTGTDKRNTLANNLPPSVHAGDDTVIFAPDAMILNGLASRDPNDVIVRYRWQLLKGPVSPHLQITTPNFPVTGVSGYEIGDYHFRLTVTDEFNVSRSDEIKISVSLPPGRNAAPIALAGDDVVTPTSSCFLYGKGRDYDGSVVRYHWKQLSGPATASVHEYDKLVDIRHLTEDGDYAFELTAFDNGSPTGIGRDTVVVKRKLVTPVYFINWSSAKRHFHGKQTIIYGLYLFSIACFCMCYRKIGTTGFT